MRSEARRENNVEVIGIQGYHGNNWTGESYAFEGFKSNKYFASDRPIKLTANMERPDGQPLAGFGLEQEVELFGDLTGFALAELMSKVIFPLFPDDLYKMQHDGSLGHDRRDRDDDEENAVGVECITQVMTKAFIRNHYKDWKTMYNTYFPAFNISASQSGRCGMHVNISNALFGKTVPEQTEAIRKLHYIVNRHFDFCCRLFNRDPRQTGYCAQMAYAGARHMDICGGSHYVCMNYSHFRADYTEVCNHLKEIGLYEVPFIGRTTGREYNGEMYKYGHGWVIQQIPEEDLQRIRDLLDSEW